MEAGELNHVRVFFFIVGVIVGACITTLLFTRPQAGFTKQYFNDCGHYADMVSRCGHGSPDTNPND